MFFEIHPCRIHTSCFSGRNVIFQIFREDIALPPSPVKFYYLQSNQACLFSKVVCFQVKGKSESFIPEKLAFFLHNAATSSATIKTTKERNH